MFRGRVNMKSVSAKIENLKDRVESEVKDDLKKIATDLTTRTPVDTGAFAESFSVVPASSGGGRSKSSKGRPRNQDKGTYRAIAEANMHSDINGLQLFENKSVSFRNRAPHASEALENKYQVFGAVKDIWR